MKLRKFMLSAPLSRESMVDLLKTARVNLYIFSGAASVPLDNLVGSMMATS